MNMYCYAGNYIIQLPHYLVFQIPNGIVLSTGATIKIENLEVYFASINGWTEIESYGVLGADQLDQLIWKGGTFD